MEEDDDESRERYQARPFGPRSSARPTTPFDIAQDLSNSLEGWRLCEIMLPVGAPSSCAWNPFCSVPFEQFPPGHTIVRAMNGPTGVVFHACGAANVTPRDFRTLNGARELGPPRADTMYEIWSLPGRPVQDERHYRRFGVRRGPISGWGGGEGANDIALV